MAGAFDIKKVHKNIIRKKFLDVVATYNIIEIAYLFYTVFVIH